MESGAQDSLAIDARGLYHIYRGRELETVALRGADLALERGSWTSVMGPSGSGKSTLLHVMAGLLEPSGGSVMLDGEDITRLSSAERAQRRRSRIGVVMQRDNLHPLLDAAGNVALPLRLDGRSREEVGSRVEQLLAAVGLLDRRRSLPGKLSGGEAQRVAIAVALAPKPRVLLADEPTGELDEENTGQLLDVLDTLRRQEATTLMTVTHNPNVAERADRRVQMRDGRVIDAG
jgi:ABC-type lipoprotein export system ATPase subunit